MSYRGGLYEAIKSIQPYAEFGIYNNDYSTLEWYDDPTVVPIPTKEEAEAAHEVLKAAYAAEQQAKADARQSALNKLMALGLTEEEALALGVK
jgi:hypothetical protein